MTRDDVKAELRDIIEDKLCVSPDSIKEESKLEEDLGADSLAFEEYINHVFPLV